MLKQMFLSAAVVAFVSGGPVCGQEQKQAQQSSPIVQVQSRHSADFKSNFDLAVRTARPAPLAPGSAEVP
jgi:hypothetical protein